MKLDPIKTSIAIAVSALIAYGFYTLNTSVNKNLVTVGSFIFLTTTLILTIGARFTLPRTTTMAKTLSAIFFLTALASNLIFSFAIFKDALYIIINGILFLIYLLIYYLIGQAKQ